MDRASVRKLEKAHPNGHAHSNGHESVRKLEKAHANGHESARKLERASSRKLERASKPSLAADATKTERASKMDVTEAAHNGASGPTKPVKKGWRTWRSELFRAMVDALRDILRSERPRA